MCDKESFKEKMSCSTVVCRTRWAIESNKTEPKHTIQEKTLKAIPVSRFCHSVVYDMPSLKIFSLQSLMSHSKMTNIPSNKKSSLEVCDQ